MSTQIKQGAKKREGMKLTPLAAALGMLLAAGGAQATTFTWNCSGSTGNWGTSACWSPTGVPGSASTGDIVHITAISGDTTAIFDAASGNRTINELNLGYAQSNNVITFSQLASNLTLNGSEIVANYGTASHIQSAGANSLPNLYVGYSSVSNGRYTLSGGSATVSNGTFVGYYGAGSFTNSGGTHSSGWMDIGMDAAATGTYTINSSSAKTSTTGNLYVGDAGSGTFVQSNGTTTVGMATYVGYSSGGQGSLSLSNGSFSSNNGMVVGYATGSQGSVIISGGAAVTESGMTVGLFGSGSVTQSGGTHKAIGSLYVGGAGTGTYAMSGGTLTSSYEVVGETGTGTFTQIGGTNTVSGDLRVGMTGKNNGSYTLSGGTLDANTITNNGTFTQSSGTLSGALTNNGTFNYSGGAITGLLINNSYVNLSANVTFQDGLINNTSLYIAPSRQVALSGSSPSVNTGSIGISGGTLYVFARLDNQGTISGYGTLGGSAQLMTDQLTNSGQIVVSGGNLVIADSLSITNTGTLTLSSTRQLQLQAGTQLASTGTTDLASGQISGDGYFVNNAGGSVTGKGMIASAFSNAGYFGVSNGTTSVSKSFVNSGLIDMNSNSANLTGGIITNTGTIQGWGNVANAVINHGTVEASGGTLALSSATSSNTGTLAAGTGTKLLFTNGLASNAGLIQLTGGTFDNGGKTMTNAAGASITGNGTLRTGGLMNNGAVNWSFGNSNVVGAITNNAGGSVVVSNGAQATFTGDIKNNGELRVSEGGAANFFGKVSGAGSFSGDGQSRFEGGFNPGNSPAMVTIGFKSTYSSSSWIEMELGGTTPGNCNTCSDKIIFNNSVTLKGGDLRVVWWNGYTGQAGDSYDLFDWNGPLTGTFGKLVLPTLADGLSWDSSQLYTSGELSIHAIPEPETYALLLTGMVTLGWLRRRRAI